VDVQIICEKNEEKKISQVAYHSEQGAIQIICDTQRLSTKVQMNFFAL